MVLTITLKVKTWRIIEQLGSALIGGIRPVWLLMGIDPALTLLLGN